MSLPRDRLATAQEVANYLNTTRGALRTQRHRGSAPGKLGIVIGRNLCFRAEDIDRWLEEQAQAQEAG